MFLDSVRIIHFMDEVTRYSTAHIVENMDMPEVFYTFELTWLSHSWNSENVIGDKKFRNK